jgi:hypothetical protein
MEKTHRDLALGYLSNGYLWCLHCNRVYKNGEFRLVEEVIPEYHDFGGEKLKTQMCPYAGCNGDTVLDGWNWSTIRERHPDYPEIPERNKVYLM